MIPLRGRPCGVHVIRAVILPALLFASIFFRVDMALASPGVEVVGSDARHLRLQVSDLVTTWREMDLQDKGVLLFEPRIEGMVTTGEAGHVRAPRQGGWLIVPPGTSPRLRVLEESWVGVGLRPLLVQPVPVMVQGADPDFKHTGEILVLPDEEIPADAPVPSGAREMVQRRGQAHTGPALELGEVRWWRGHRIVAWSLRPLRHDGRQATESLTSGSWEIVFEADKAAARIPAGHDARFTTRGDDQFAGMFLNGELLERLPTAAVHSGVERPRADKSAAGKGTLLGNMEGRIAVPSTRLYRVTAERLRAQGFLPAGAVDEDQIRLYQRRYLPRLDDGSGDVPYAEIEVPIHMVGDGGEFSGDDFFVFYGLRPRDDEDFTADVGQGDELIFGCGDNDEYHNTGNIYWVAAAEPDAGQSWARMDSRPLDKASGTLLTSYRREDHFEEQVAYRQNVYSDAVDRLCMNNYRDPEVSVAFNPLWSPLTTGSDIQLQVAVANQNIYAQSLHFELNTDNSLITSLGDVQLGSEESAVLDLSAGAGAFDGASSKLVMTNNGDDKVWTWLNYVKLSYDARYEAVGNRLQFHGGLGTGNRPIEVTGFTNSDLGLIEVTDPRRPVWIALNGDNIVADGGGYKLSIMPEQGAEKRHFVATGSFTTTGVGEFNHYEASLAADQINPLAHEGGDPDVLVVTHPQFREAAQRWIDHRQARSGGDLDIHVTEVQDLYDWYSGGMKDPWAIKRLATHAINEWGTWAMVIIGDANENAHQLNVPVEARNWSVDWVPTHFHIQDTGQYLPEVMATDKWYVTFEAGMNYPQDDFPDSVYSPWQMYLGRLPCNSVADLNTMIDKIMLVDNVQDGQDWRRRMVLMADDAWSGGYGTTANVLTYRSWEDAFEDVEREIMSPLWEGGTPVTLEADTLFLDTYLHEVWVNEGRPSERGTTAYQDWVENTDALQDLRDAMNAGGLFLHYQGHANSKVLCSEYWFEDFPAGAGSQRQDVQNLVNADRPWVFFGMGCHISDWAQDPVSSGTVTIEPSLGEKFLTHAGGGASATYGSSGYEYITPNRDFGEYMIYRWINSPPAARIVPEAEPTVAHRSRWMLGELMWYCEADILASYVGATYREMVAQYQLLGDPLMMLDAGPPMVTATIDGTGGQEISGTFELEALDASGVRVIEIDARDEAGIERLQVIDSEGIDLTEQISTETLPAGEDDHQQVAYSLEVPVRPMAHQIFIRVYGSGAPLETDPHYNLVLNVSHEAVFLVDGQEITQGAFPFAPEEPVDFQFTMTSGAWLGSELPVEIQGDNLTVSNVVVQQDKSSTMTGSFTATAEPGTSGDRRVTFVIGGVESHFTLEGSGAELPEAAITKVMNYPNPMSDGTRFVFETTASHGEGQVRVFSVAGRTVANIPFTYDDDDPSVIFWDGRDNEGDGLANGTYLYRLEMQTPSGMLVSPMQRLVVMN